MNDHGDIKVLLVDDNSNNLMSMELVLENGGYNLFTATSGREALRILLKEEEFSLILLDVKMPIMDGYETAELIYQRDKLKHIPIIFFTAHDYEEEAIFKGYRVGAVDFIRKPVKPELLRTKVAIFTEIHRKNLLLRKQEERLRVINNELMDLNSELEKRVRDRTIELERANKELKDLNISKDKFLSVISHDLRNPLTSLLLASKNLHDQVESLSPPKLKMLSGVIHRTSNKILQQLNELVEWAKMQREKTNFNPERLHLINEVTRAFELIKPSAAFKSINFENKVLPEIYIEADQLMLRSVLQNIVTNAIKFSTEGGTVEVTAGYNASMVEIRVKDFGVGMSPEIKERLLNSPDSLSSLGTNLEEGSGLGLILVKDFVAQHKGVISIDSEPGKGTCFSFTVPRSTIYQNA